MTWKRLNGFRGRCPVCSNLNRRDCRENTTRNLIHCRDPLTNPIDWVFRGIDALGFAMWAHKDDAQAWAEEQREEQKEEWRRQWQLKREQEQRKEAEERASSLTEEQRDLHMRAVLAQLTLSEKHRFQLHKRGLTDEQIEQGGYRSVGKWQNLLIPVDDRLAGVKRGGNSLLTPGTGIICPVANEKGQFVAWQLRLDRPLDGAKYIWAAGEKKRSPRPTSHLRSGELPLSIYVQEASKDADTVGLAEGVAFKPHLASIRLSIPVIGASGGNFASSPKTLKRYLEYLGRKRVVLYADAGSVLNRQVLNSYQKTISLLQEWGYEAKVAWWKQVEKSVGDIDEISPGKIKTIEHLSPEEFFDLARKLQYKKECWGNWRKAKKFTAQIKIKKRYFEAEFPEDGTILFVKSGLGTGKTEWTLKLLDHLREFGAINLGYRNTLLLQFCEKANSKDKRTGREPLGFVHLHEDNAHLFTADPKSNVVNCINSIGHYQPEDFDGKVIILDEVVSVIKHLLYSGTIGNFTKVINLFEEAIRRAKMVICLDGFMADWVVKYFKQICPEKKTLTIENTYKGDKPDIYLLEGTFDVKNEKIKINDRTPWLEKLLNESAIPAICSDSQIFIEAMDELLSKQGRKTLRADSKTAPTKEIKEFLKNPERYIRDNYIEALLYTPTAESGLDIRITDYFTEHFCFFFGVLDVDAIMQMIGRIRDSQVPRYLWVKKYVDPEYGDISSRSTDIHKLAAARFKAINQEINLVLAEETESEKIIQRIQDIQRQNTNAHSEAADQIKVVWNHEKPNLRECVKLTLIENGYPVQSVTPEILENASDLTDLEKKAKKQVKEKNSRDIFNASDLRLNDTNLHLGFNASWEQLCEVFKARLCQRLPGIRNHPVWSAEFIKLVKYDEPNLIQGAELFWLLYHPEVAKRRAQESYHRMFEKGNNQERIAPWKLRQTYLYIQTLINVHIKELLKNPQATYTADSPLIKKIIAACSQKEVVQVLGCKPKKDAIKFVGFLLKALGLRWTPRQIKLPDGTNYRVYSINPVDFNCYERNVVLEAIDNKWSKYKDENWQSPQWVFEPENESKMTEVEESAESKTVQGLDQVALCPKNYIYINSQSATEKNNDLIATCLETSQGHFDRDRTLKVDCLSEQNINDLARWLTEKEISDDELRQELKLAPFPTLDGILSRIYQQLGSEAFETNKRRLEGIFEGYRYRGAMSDENIQDVASILETLPSAPELLDTLKEVGSVAIKAAWELLHKTYGVQFVQSLWRHIKNQNSEWELGCQFEF